MMAHCDLDVAEAKKLAFDAAGGDRAALSTLQDLLWPELLRLAATSARMRVLEGDEDHAREIAVCVIEKLGRDGCRALKLFVAWSDRHPEKTFYDWLRIISANVMRDYLRVHHRRNIDPSAIRVINEFATSCGAEELRLHPHMTPAQTARQLIEFARQHLGDEQNRALGHWLQGMDHIEIAEQLKLTDANEARNLLRAAIASLRRQFRPDQLKTKH